MRPIVADIQRDVKEAHGSEGSGEHSDASSNASELDFNSDREEEQKLKVSDPDNVYMPAW